MTPKPVRTMLAGIALAAALAGAAESIGATAFADADSGLSWLTMAAIGMAKRQATTNLTSGRAQDCTVELSEPFVLNGTAAAVFVDATLDVSPPEDPLNATVDASAAAAALTMERRAAVCDEFLWSWRAYEAHAWGRDELRPLSQTADDWVPGGMGLTILDSVDALWLMDLEPELGRARAFVSNLSFNVNAEVNTFETTIRALGGLLAAHSLTGDALYLERATDLGKRLLAAFKTETGLPAPNVNLKTRKPGHAHWSYDFCTAEVGSLTLEFNELSRATGDRRFAAAVERVGDHLAKRARRLRPKHLMPIFFTPDGEPSTTAMTSLGARGDSYYEYLLKAWLQRDRTEPRLRARYVNSVGAIAKHLVRRTAGGVTFVAEQYPHGPLRPKMDHLACFLPGMLALGAASGGIDGEGRNHSASHMELAEQLMETCWLMYERTPTGLAAEIVMFHEHGGAADFSSSAEDAHTLLRPETVESLFVLWRLTHDQRYRERGWRIFEAFRAHCRVETGGYASAESVLELPVRLRDKQESFWLAETLKYLFLLFSDDDVLPLDQWVFNTEAHPLPISPRGEATQ